MHVNIFELLRSQWLDDEYNSLADDWNIISYISILAYILCYNELCSARLHVKPGVQKKLS